MNYNYCENKVFLVTGVSSGIGLETARLLLENKAIVYGLIRKPSETTDQLIKEYRGSFVPISGDVTKQKDCEKFVSFAFKKSKIIHGIIHCAGLGIRSSARNISRDVFHMVMETNFSSHVYLYNAIRTHLEKTNGHFVAISSIQGLMILPYRSVYAAAKHALNAYIRSVRLEEKDISFLVVNFGYVNTGFSKNALMGSGQKYMIQDKSQSRGMPPRKAAAIILQNMIARKKQCTPAGLKEKVALLVYRLCPAIYDRFIVKYVREQ